MHGRRNGPDHTEGMPKAPRTRTPPDPREPPTREAPSGRKAGLPDAYLATLGTLLPLRTGCSPEAEPRRGRRSLSAATRIRWSIARSVACLGRPGSGGLPGWCIRCPSRTAWGGSCCDVCVWFAWGACEHTLPALKSSQSPCIFICSARFIPVCREFALASSRCLFFSSGDCRGGLEGASDLN